MSKLVASEGQKTKKYDGLPFYSLVFKDAGIIKMPAHVKMLNDASRDILVDVEEEVRAGWELNVSNLEDFQRDYMPPELGATYVSSVYFSILREKLATFERSLAVTPSTVSVFEGIRYVPTFLKDEQSCDFIPYGHLIKS